MEPHFSGVIFDLDGTLVDTIADIGHAMNRSLAEFGLLPSTVDEYRARVGWGLRVLVRKTLGPDNTSLEDDVVSRFLRHYAEEPFLRSEVYPGVHDALEQLTTNGVPVAVCSNKPHPHTEKVVELAYPDIGFAGVFGHRDGSERKPHPGAALELAKAMDVSPRDVAFVGDSDVDLETARAAGMVPVLVGWGFRPPEDLRDIGAERFLEDQNDLSSFVRDIVGA